MSVKAVTSMEEAIAGSMPKARIAGCGRWCSTGGQSLGPPVFPPVAPEAAEGKYVLYRELVAGVRLDRESGISPA